MPLAAEKEMAPIGESQGASDHDLIHELRKLLDALCRYDQHVANTEGQIDLPNFWQDLKAQEQINVQRLKDLVAEQCRNECF
jgi:hypothetical protein